MGDHDVYVYDSHDLGSTMVDDGPTWHSSCNACGEDLGDGPPESKCRECGSPELLVKITSSDSATVHEMAVLSDRDPPGVSKKYERRRVKAGDDLTRKTGRWSYRYMEVDERNNQYYEIVKDLETGAVLREVREPLDQHRGRGSAR